MCFFEKLKQWFLFTDAAYEPETGCGGLGAALFSEECDCVGWFGLPLNAETCLQLGGGVKQTIIYELEWLASILGLDCWADRMRDGLQVCYGDNDSARFFLIRGSCLGPYASSLMRYHLEREAITRVPTEANVSDFPSRHVPHPLFHDALDESAVALMWFENLLSACLRGHAESNGEASQLVPGV